MDGNAMDVPDPASLVWEGVLFERAGSLERALRCYRGAAARAEDAITLAEAWRRESKVLRCRCAWDEALDAAARSAEAAKISGSAQLLSEALNAEAAVHMSRGDLSRAVSLYERMLGTTDEPRIRGLALQNLGSIAAIEHDFPASQDFFLDSYRAFRTAGYARGLATATLNYGAAAVLRGEFELAEPIFERAIALTRDVNDDELVALAMKNHAEALAGQSKRLAFAESRLTPAIGFFAITENRYRKVECLRLLGDIRVQQERTGEAARSWRLALTLAGEIGARVEASRLRDRLAAIGADPGRPPSTANASG